MKIDVNSTRLGSFGAQLLIIGIMLIFADGMFRVVELLIGSDWTLLGTGVFTALIGLVFVVVAALLGAKEES